MSSPDRSRFVYVTVIRTTPEKRWEALTDPEFTYQYWFGIRVESGWATGASWAMRRSDGSIDSAGEIIEIERTRRLVVRWQNEWKPELKAAATMSGYASVNGLRMYFEIDGEGPPLVFIRGHLAVADVRAVPALTKAHRVVTSARLPIATSERGYHLGETR